MTAETLKVIVQGLNDEPFNMKLNVIYFNALSAEKLLQILSDVLRWIESAPRIEILQESAEDTALRIFDTLRVLRYKPSINHEQLQEWRKGIVEGEKSAVYPILEWVFNNSDKLKERIYLAKYLTKIDIPAETRKDTILVEDIKSDLKSMEQEKEHLLKKVEKTEEKLKNVPNAEKLLELVNTFRLEKQHEDVLTLQIQEQRNLVTHLSMKAERLRAHLDELKKAGDEATDSKVILKQLQEELETNRYIVKEKLPKEIQSKQAVVAELSKVANMPAINESDIADIQEKIQAVNQEILAMAKKQEDDDSSNEFSLYRYQVTAIDRKKAALAEKLQKNRAELERLEKLVETKKNELRTKTGETDIISTTEFKKYANDVRIKANNYRKLREHIDLLKAEENVISDTNVILKAQWEADKERIERQGGVVIEQESKKRPRTTRPETTNIIELKTMIRTLNETLNSEREYSGQLKEESGRLKAEYVDLQQKYQSKKKLFDDAQQQTDDGNAQLIENVQQMKKQIAELRQQIETKTLELGNAQETLFSLERRSDSGEDDAIQKVEKQISQTKTRISEIQRSLSESADDEDSAIDKDEQDEKYRNGDKEGLILSEIRKNITFANSKSNLFHLLRQ